MKMEAGDTYWDLRGLGLKVEQHYGDFIQNSISARYEREMVSKGLEASVSFVKTSSHISVEALLP